MANKDEAMWESRIMIDGVSRRVCCVGTRRPDEEGRHVYGFGVRDADSGEDLTEYDRTPWSSLERWIDELLAQSAA
jgi:hypothetical protein